MRFLSLVFLPILLIQLSHTSMAAPGITGTLGKGLSYINPMKILEYFPDVEHLDVRQVQILIGKLLEAAQAMKSMKKDYKAKKEAAEKATKRAVPIDEDDIEVTDTGDLDDELDVDAGSRQRNCLLFVKPKGLIGIRCQRTDRVVVSLVSRR